MLNGTLAFSNFLENEPSITNFFISNTEVQNLDNGKYLFKRTDCETMGYSFYSPYHENPNLVESIISINENNNDIEVEISSNSSNYKATLSEFSVNKDRTAVSFNVKKGNVIFESQMLGENLTVDYVKNSILNLNDMPTINEDCPICVVVVVVAIAEVCLNAQEACSPCNGSLTVGACSCSCTPQT